MSNANTRRGKFIVIDGIGGSGKSSHVALLKKCFPRFVFTHEPGGAPYAEKIRDVLLRGLGPVGNPLADFFLFWAARAEHVRDRIEPALRRGRTVVSDRFDSSTFAFQIFGERHRELEELFWEARAATLNGARPDLYLILDVPVTQAAARRRARTNSKDRFDEREAAFQRRVREGYRAFAKRMGKCSVVVDASRDLAEVEADIERIITRLLARHRGAVR